jgi:hypothetical protein
MVSGTLPVLHQTEVTFMKRLALIGFALALSASSDSTGPKNVNVAGSWTYSVTNLVGGGLSCNTGGTTVTIAQSGTTFSGTYTGGTLSCNSLGDFAIGTGTVANGTVSDNAVAFDFDTQDWANTGSASGNTISGTATVRLVTSSNQTIILTGNFSMVKR